MLKTVTKIGRIVIRIRDAGRYQIFEADDAKAKRSKIFFSFEDFF